MHVTSVGQMASGVLWILEPPKRRKIFRQHSCGPSRAISAQHTVTASSELCPSETPGTYSKNKTGNAAVCHVSLFFNFMERMSMNRQMRQCTVNEWINESSVCLCWRLRPVCLHIRKHKGHVINITWAGVLLTSTHKCYHTLHYVCRLSQVSWLVYLY